jgi:hypothetical protein
MEVDEQMKYTLYVLREYLILVRLVMTDAVGCGELVQPPV